jgi:membrane protease YdiL (CAAX protease family)
MVILANAAVGKTWAGHATGILTGLLAGATFLFGAIDFASAGSGNPFGIDAGIMVTAVVAATLSAKPVRERVARVIPVDPDNPVHSVALVLAVILFGTQIASIAFTNVLVTDQQQPALTIGDLLAQEAPFLVLAAAGVGLSIRRNLAATSARLGLVVPAWWHIALALAAAGVFFAIGQGAQVLSQSLTPSVAQQVDKTAQHLFGGLGDPVGIVALAFLPGICEEILFRGALQPRLGLIATAVLFAAIHTEYGLSIDVLTIFVIAIGLGLIRKYANTTASCTCHITYNLLVGFGLTGATLIGGIAVEAVLLGLLGYKLWKSRQTAPESLVESTGVS